MIIKILFSALIIFSFFPAVSFAAVSLPWSTTYNCADWASSVNGLYNVNCDGLNGNGNWQCDNGNGTTKEEQITVAANNSSGGGGKGQRHWHGDGVNNVSGGININFDKPYGELWVRTYIKWQAGFQWGAPSSSAQKIIYLFPTSGSYTALGIINGQIGIQRSNDNFLSGLYWTDIMGGNSSDGLWHVLEWHVKLNTSGMTNGVAEVWVDGNLIRSRTDLDFSTNAGWSSALIGSNSANPNNGGCMAVDFDDIKISNTGYIGPISGGSVADTTPPSAPTGVVVS